MRSVSPLFPAVLALALALASAPALAAPTNGDCMECHGDAETKRSDGRPVTVDATVFARSVHGEADLACVDCHADLAALEDFPHAEKLAPARCDSCHAEQQSGYEKSIHARARRSGDTDAARCAGCHGSHDILPAKDPRSRTSHFRLPETCGSCHGDPELIKRAGIAAGDTFHMFQDSIHGKALLKAGLTVAPNCSDCHRAHDILERKDPSSPVARRNVPATCGRCHQGILVQFEDSVHGHKTGAGMGGAPVCIDCHSAHQIRRTDLASWRLDVLRECGTCHAGMLRSYGDTFHGQVTALGFVRVATCSDCHGSHRIYPKDDPRSTISAERRVETCRTCHPSANANFARYDPHVDPADRDRSPALFYSAQFMHWLLVGVFSFFGGHTVLWLVRGLVDKGMKRRPRPATGSPEGETDVHA